MIYKKCIVGLIMVYLSVANIYAQNNTNTKERVLVNQVILKLFEGMREGDSAKVHDVFHQNIIMYSLYVTKQGEKVLKRGDLNEFLVAIGTPHENIWDERISNTTIKIDDNLTQVWTNYSFYLDEKFSHCGVDAFQLIKDKKSQWKIINLIDTRRIKACNKE